MPVTKQILETILETGRQVSAREYVEHCKTHNVKTFYFFCERLNQEAPNKFLEAPQLTKSRASLI
jgi:hypothetical protein